MTPAELDEVLGLLWRRWESDPAEWADVLEPLVYEHTVAAFAACRDKYMRRPTVGEFREAYSEFDPTIRFALSEVERQAGLERLAWLRTQLPATRGTI